MYFKLAFRIFIFTCLQFVFFPKVIFMAVDISVVVSYLFLFLWLPRQEIFHSFA